MMRHRWIGAVMALVAIVGASLVATAAPAHAVGVFVCQHPAAGEAICNVPYQTFPYGQTTGLRSSMMGDVSGDPDGVGIHARQEVGRDSMRIELRVWDLKEDGYRARVWVDLYKGCWCTGSQFHHSDIPSGTQGSNRVFDALNSSGTTSVWDWSPPTGEPNYTNYTVRFVLGRYQSSTGTYQKGEEQIYYFHF